MSSGKRKLLLLYIIQTLWIASWSASVGGPVMPLYVVSLGVGEKEWGFLAMSLAIGMVLFEWLWGALSDRGNRMIYALFSLAVMSVIFPLYTIKSLLPYFFLLQFLLGVFFVILGPVSRAIVSDTSDPESLGLSMSLWSVFMTLGSMFGAIIGSYFSQNWSYEYSFYLSTFLSVLGGIVALSQLRIEEERKRNHEINLKKSFRIGLRNLTDNSSLRTLLFIAVMSFMARSVIWTFLPLYASVIVGMSTVEVGLLSAVISFTGLLASIVIGKFSYLIKRYMIVSSGFFIASILLVSYYFIETKPLTYLVSIGVSIALSASPLMLALLSELSPKEHLGMSMGIFGSFEDLGLMIGPAIYGLVWANFQPGYIFIVSGIAQLISAFLALTLRTEE